MNPRRSVQSLLVYVLFPLSGLLIAGTLYAQQQTFPYLAETTADNVNVRAGQSVNFERLCQLKQGEEVVVVDQQFSWIKIQLPAKAKSYIHKKYVQLLSPNAGGIIADKVNIRAGAGIHYTILGQIDKGEQILIEEELDEWYRIRPVKNSYGWITEGYIAFKSNDTSAYAAESNAGAALPVVEEKYNWRKKVKAYHESRQKQRLEEEIQIRDEEPEQKEEMLKEAQGKVQTLEVVDVESAEQKEQAGMQDKKAKAMWEVIPEDNAEDIPDVQVSEAIREMEISDMGIVSFAGYVEIYENKGKDGIYYKIVNEGAPVCYVQGPNQMLGRFLNQKVAIDGTVNQKYLSKYQYPVMIISRIRLMI